jgi:predicted phosphoribosyltransferase
MLTRAEAGRRLALGVKAVVSDAPVIRALSPGGVRLGSELARAFGSPLDVVAVTRLEVPGRPHSVFGAVADGTAIVVPERVRDLALPEGYVTRLVALTRRDVDQVTRTWRDGVPPVEIKGRTVILADDGVSDALLVIAAARALREEGASRLIYAAPSASPDLCRRLDPYCDHRVLLYPPETDTDPGICDAQFEHTTRFDIGRLVRLSRETAAAG